MQQYYITDLQCSTSSIVHIWQYLHWLFEHDSEGVGWPITAETCIILAQRCVTVCVNDLQQPKYVRINGKNIMTDSFKPQRIRDIPAQTCMLTW